MSIKKKLREVGFIRMAYNYYVHFIRSHFLFKPVSFLSNNFWYWKDYRKYKSLPTNKQFKFHIGDALPITADKTTYTPVEPIYFFQDCWLAKKIFENRPAHHYDVGSSAEAIGLISQFVPTTMIDIRPIELQLPGLHFVKGSILELPFQDNSIASISSISVVEHIGLGRFGDPLDTFGSEKSAKEMQRVAAIGGLIYIALPVDSENKILFNAHRTFTPHYFKSLFDQCELVEEKFIYGTEMGEEYFPEKGYGTGLFMFRKIK